MIHFHLPAEVSVQPLQLSCKPRRRIAILLQMLGITALSLQSFTAATYRKKGAKCWCNLTIFI